MEDELVRTFEYRGISVPIYVNEPGQCFWTILDGTEIGFGSFNTDYEEDLKYLIDQKLDLICRFDNFPGAKLEWFDNGFNYRDIRLVYKTRTVKIFLVHGTVTPDIIETLKTESESILKKVAEVSKL